jgi:lipopolysaccharide transport protein LptA
VSALILAILLFLSASVPSLFAQTAASAAPGSSPAPTAQKSPSDKTEARDLKTQLITTEIYADEAFFDSEKNIGKFTGRVKVTDPRFNLQSDKLTAYIGKESQGLERAVATGNVGVVRDRPDPKGGPPKRSVGLAEHAVYTTKDGMMELTGNPRVQQGINTHVATSPNTVMLLNQDGQLETRGPSRTEIRQEPKTEPSPGASPKP